VLNLKGSGMMYPFVKMLLANSPRVPFSHKAGTPLRGDTVLRGAGLWRLCLLVQDTRQAFNRPKMTRKAQRGSGSRFASNISSDTALNSFGGSHHASCHVNAKSFRTPRVSQTVLDLITEIHCSIRPLTTNQTGSICGNNARVQPRRSGLPTKKTMYSGLNTQTPSVATGRAEKHRPLRKSADRCGASSTI
jgi:hypothetical protein